MADTKISALPTATLPLAGTEVLPIVQGGTTDQVSVANLTAGRAVSATQLTLTTGNLIVASGQGVDFSATPGTGTSELLNDYEEGTWTPTYVPSGTNFTSITYAIQQGAYTKVGRQVTVRFLLRTSAITIGSASGNISVRGLPFAVAAQGNGTGVASGTLGWADNFPISGIASASQIDLHYRDVSDARDRLNTPTDMGTGASSNDLYMSLTYFT